MITITGFADEIAGDLEKQMNVLESEAIYHIELRGIWGKNVLKLTDDELEKAKRMLDSRGFSISSIGSPIGKYGIQDDFQVEIENMKRATKVANLFKSPYIRVFSYFVSEGEHSQYREQVISRMKQLSALASESDVILLMENESGVYGNTDERCLDLLSSCDHPCLRLAFDPGNFVMNRVKPVSQALPKLQSYLEYVHVKDAIYDKGMFVPAGEGEGEFVPFIQGLKQNNFSGYLSIEPHLQKYLPDLDDPGRFIYAIKALKKLLHEADLTWK
jgi:sugar phosphate isomerase/epimerase